MKRFLLLSLVLAGCATGPMWVQPNGAPVDPLVELRCEEYVMAKNGPRFTGFESHDRTECMKAHGYVRPWAVKR